MGFRFGHIHAEYSTILPGMIPPREYEGLPVEK